MQLPVVAAVAAVAVVGAASVQPAAASGTPFFFTTGDPNGLIATASRPGSGGAFEIESADDFVLTGPTTLTSATFTGLIPTGSSVTNVVVEIYGVFPQASNVGRTSGPPTFSTPQVPTRVNSPSDVALDSRDSSTPGDLTFMTTTLAATFTALNSVKPGGIHPQPGQTTGGNLSVTGEETEFDVAFTDPFSLAPGHYFFVPQVELDTGDFLWLSAPRPIVPPGTPFPAGFTDLQSWTRDQFLDPDWLRIGTDIVGAGAFNASFSLTGVIPEPGTLAILGTGLLGMAFLRRRAR
jgi:hypothetical protein